MEITKTNLLNLPLVPGVYTFWSENTPIYIGKAINLKSRLKSYFTNNLLPKTEKMVKSADKMTFIKVLSDLEALLLEAELIRKYKPKYNILLKDDKHALYIVITKEEFPRVLPVRKLWLEGQKLTAIFGPFPNSTNVKTILKLIRKIFPFSDHKLGKKPCLYSHLGLCFPCPNTIKTETDAKKYKDNIRNIKLVLTRKFNVVRGSLEKEMTTLSKQQKYEEAKVVRDKIKTLDYITQERIDTEKFIENPNLTEDLRARELESLGHIVKVSSLNRIECFDIAHLSGISATASMVVAINGEMEHSEYKHFKVRQKKGQSDYDSMREIVKRRINNFEGWGRPDLIIVDGGLGQVKIFQEACKDLYIPVVGIAKNPDRLIFSNGTKIRLQNDTLHLVARMRDEAHRFARRLHHKLIAKSLIS